MNFDVNSRTILRVRHGSHAYGTNIDGSDVDERGVCIEPEKYHLGFLNRFEQYVANGDKDLTIYSLKKFVRLAVDCNPNVLEILFVDESDVLKKDDFGALLMNWRRLFLTRKARHTFVGYSRSQLKRIKRKQYKDWGKNRSLKRASLEAYDTKHGMHLIRLLRMGKEILSEGVVRVRRPDADELLAIRRGERDFESLVAEATRLEAECEYWYDKSPLPMVPDTKEIDLLVVRMVREYTRLYG